MNGSFWQKVSFFVLSLLLSTLLAVLIAVIIESNKNFIKVAKNISAIEISLSNLSSTYSADIRSTRIRLNKIEAQIDRGILPLADQHLKRLNRLHMIDSPHFKGGGR